MPVHSVELGHLVLLNIDVQDTGESFCQIYRYGQGSPRVVFKPSDFAIINTDGQSDFDIEHRVSLRDLNERKLDLKLNYVYVS